MNHRLGVKFAVEGIPDCAGLRIKTLEPKGLYVSSEDPEAAKWHFENKVVEYVGACKLLASEKGGGWTLTERIDWDAALLAGEAQVAVRTVSAAEARFVRSEGELLLAPPVQMLTVEWFQNSEGAQICIVRDEGDLIDDWIVKAVLADVPKYVSG